MRLWELNFLAAVLLAPARPAAFRRTTAPFAFFHPIRFILSNLNTQRAIHDRKQCRDWFFCDSTPQKVFDGCFERLEEESYLVCLELLFRLKVVWRGEAGIPVLVLGARKDGVVPVKIVEQVAALYGTQAKIFENMGHDLMLESRWEQVAERIVCWLKELKLPPCPNNNSPD
jgi:pimeloyl-ACP methyl ester carboxylesterase